MQGRMKAALGLCVLAGALTTTGLSPSDAGATCGATKLSLTPATQTKTLGETASTKALLLDVCTPPKPEKGFSIKFTVTAGPNIGKTFFQKTDANGNATFNYTSTKVGTDTVIAQNVDGYKSTSNPVTVTWIAPKLKFKCRASELRLDVLNALGINLLTAEPFVSNAPYDPCLTDSDTFLDVDVDLGLPLLGLSAVDAETIATTTTKDKSATVPAEATTEVQFASVMNLPALGIGVTADAITSEAHATCSGGTLSFSGSSNIVNAKIGGTTVNGNAYAEISLLGGLAKAYVNRTIVTSSEVIQRGIEITLNGKEVLVLGEAKVGKAAVQAPGAAC